MLQKKFQAGDYKKQYQYESFSPAFVNREADWLSERKVTLAKKADEDIQELKIFLEENKEVVNFVDVLQLKEAVASSRMDGAKVNFTEALLPLEFIKSDRMNDWLDVKNYLDAMRFSFQRVDDIPISFRLFNEIHSIALAGPNGEKKSPGEVRKSQNWVGGESLSKALYIPPHPDELQDYLSDLEKFIHNDYLDIPFLVKVALAHYQFLILQPYVSGNGRMARLLVLLMMYEHYNFAYPVFLLFDLLEFYTVPFHEALFAVPKTDNMNQYIKFFLLRLSDAAKRSCTTLEKLVALKSKKENIADGLHEAEKIYLILLEFYKKPVMHEKEIKSKFRDFNIMQIMKKMEENKIIEDFTEMEDEKFFYLKKIYNQLKM